MSVKLMERRDEFKVVPSPLSQSCPESMDEAVGQVEALGSDTAGGVLLHGKIGMLQSALSLCQMIHSIPCFQTLSCGSQQLLQR